MSTTRRIKKERVLPDDYSNRIPDIIADFIPYFLDAFDKGCEGREIYGFSIQLSPDGTFKGTLRARLQRGTEREFGQCAYTTSESVGELLQYFEDGLAYDDLDWREDKFFRVASGERQNRPKNAVRRSLG
uniref:Uncharacterized protein n=1 Tax=uncultured prokaryote TaxID=198431 RepID=A0A0H5Q453_9ZZZZ|nr:hypothetical protein [uncultured prokaryote]